jgi:DNA polymerase I-like protein with 3'-5' exonuclease and polymerase domains
MVPQLWSATDYHRNLLAPVGEVVIGMERTGIPVDRAALTDIETRMADRSVALRRELADWHPGDINWASWQQLATWFHSTWAEEADELQRDREIWEPFYGCSRGLGMEPSPYCKKGEVPDDKISTDDRALEWLAGHNPEHRDAINALRALRQCERMGRYARDWLDKALPHRDGTWRLHPSFGLATDHDTRAGAVTGRFGVKNPPLNQVPRNPAKDPAGMRAAFVPPPGHRLIVIDYAQLEVVIIAHLIATLFGDDDPLVRRVRANKDVHGPLAHYIFGELMGDEAVKAIDPEQMKKHRGDLRDLGKVAIYRANYGGNTAKGYAFSTFLPDGNPLGMERGQLLVDGLAGFYPGVLQYQSFIRKFIERYAYIVTLFGRWQPLPHAKSPTTSWRNRAWRQALNYPMQGGGQEIMALALVQIAADALLREMGFVLSLVVHDEIIGWCPEENADAALERVMHFMTTVVELLCPLRAEGHHGPNWKACK